MIEEYGRKIKEIKALCDLGVGGQKGIVYYPFGICSALTATQYKDPHKVLLKKTEKSGFITMETETNTSLATTRIQPRDLSEVCIVHAVYPRQSEQGIIKIPSKYVLNPMPNGTCRTLKNQYYKNSISNFESIGSFGATGVIELWK